MIGRPGSAVWLLGYEARLRAEVPALRRIYVEPGFDEHAARA